MTLEVFPVWMLYRDYTIPVGSLVMFAGACTDQTTSPPSGWLICDGREVSRNTYNKLFKVIGTTYGSGDGTTTFNLPNLTHTTDSSGTFRPGYIKGTAPEFDGSNYSWGTSPLPGSTENEQFDLNTVTLDVDVNASISEYSPGLSQWQVTLGSGNDNTHSHMSGGNASALPDRYRYTYIDDTYYQTASHDNSRPASSQYHLIGQERQHSEWVFKNEGKSVEDVQAEGYSRPYGSYYNQQGKPERMTDQFDTFSVWNHSHRNDYTHTTSSASQGIIGGIAHPGSQIGENQSTIGSFSAFNGTFYVDGSPSLPYSLGSGSASYGQEDGPYDSTNKPDELKGFGTGDRYLSLGTFNSSYSTNRSFTVRADTRYANVVEFELIGGTDSNGGERPNNYGEGLYCQINNNRIVQVIPSVQEFIADGKSSSEWDSLYGSWHRYKLPLTYIDENKLDCEFKFFAKSYAQPEIQVKYGRTNLTASELVTNPAYSTIIGPGCATYNFRDGLAQNLNPNSKGNGNNEWGGFVQPSGGEDGSGNWSDGGKTSNKYISFGTFQSPHVSNRSINFKLNTNSVDSVTFTLIAGDDENGGERPNDIDESLYLEINNPDGGSRSNILLIPSANKYANDNLGQGKTENELLLEWDNIYGKWRDYRINLKQNERGPNVQFRIYSFSFPTSSWDDELLNATEFAAAIVNATISYRNAVDHYGFYQISLLEDQNYSGIDIKNYLNSNDHYALRLLETKYENSVKWYSNTKRAIYPSSDIQAQTIGLQYMNFELNEGCALYEERRGSSNPGPGKNINPNGLGNGNNEFGGFEISTSGSVQNYIAFGTFNSPYRVQRRSATFTLNTTGLRNIGVWLIAGNDKNGGERSNNSSSESFYVKVNGGSSYKLIPSAQDTSSWPEWVNNRDEWDEFYGEWREYFIEEGWFPKQTTCVFEFYSETTQLRVQDLDQHNEITASNYPSSWEDDSIFSLHRNWIDVYGLKGLTFYNNTGMNVSLNSNTSLKRFRSGPSSSTTVPVGFGTGYGSTPSEYVPGEFGGFEATNAYDKNNTNNAVQNEYIMFGDYTSGFTSQRKATLTFDTRGAVMVELRLIAGNDSNGGETPNDDDESLYVLVDGNRRLEAIPSYQKFRTGPLPPGINQTQVNDRWKTLYGNWHSYYIFLKESERKENLSIVLQTNTGSPTPGEAFIDYGFDSLSEFANAYDTYGLAYGAVHYSTSCLWDFGQKTSLVKYQSGPTSTSRGGPNNSNEFAGFSADSDGNSNSYLMMGIWAPVVGTGASDGSAVGGTPQPTDLVSGKPAGERKISFRTNTRRIKRMDVRLRQGNDNNGGENPNTAGEILYMNVSNNSDSLVLKSEVIALNGISESTFHNWGTYEYNLTGDSREDSAIVSFVDNVDIQTFVAWPNDPGGAGDEMDESAPQDYNPQRNFPLATETRGIAWIEVKYDDTSNFPLPHGTGSEGSHTHSLSFNLNRGHNHAITGQTGSLNISGQDSSVEPRHLPMVFIIHTG
jgi:hypothetical protein